MSQQIQFRAGQSQVFVATRTFALGNSGMNVPNGSEVSFDGTYVTYAGAPPVVMPSLRGAVKVGWLVPKESYDPNDQSSSIPRSAGIQVRSADGGNPLDPQPKAMVTTVDSEEQEVTNVASHAQQTKDRNNVRPGRRITGAVSVEPQEGIPVRALQNPAKQTTNLETTSVREAVRMAEDNAVIRPGRGHTRDELKAAMTPKQRAAYEAEIAAKRSAYVDDPAPVVGRVKSSPTTQEKEGFTIQTSVGGGTATFDASGTDTPVETATIESEGMIFKTTNGPKKSVQKADAPVVKKVGNGDPRRLVAKAVCSDFPDLYNFDDSTRKKVARIQADFEDRPDIIQAIYASENDEVKKRLVEEFPEAFAS